jgi:glyoxylase-like metal-dependent hydrolase (beta-lactamase superfamily II)
VNKEARASVLVDTLTDERLTRNMLDAMEPLIKTNPLQTLLHTHGDIDHVYGNQLVVDQVSEVTSHEEHALTFVTAPQSVKRTV